MMTSVLALCTTTITKTPYMAVVIQPIADALGSPIQTFFPTIDPVTAYNNLPVSGGKPLVSSSCPRIHQLLFNEKGTVIKEQDQEVLIKINTCFYITHSNKSAQHSYWTHKKNIMPFKELKEKKIDTNLFPPSISFSNPLSITNNKVVTLVKPWSDPSTNQTFSAGTRFLKSENQSVENGVTVYLYNIFIGDFSQITIPHSFIAPIAHDTQKKINLFLQILKQWANLDHGYIPYVWGGCSFISTAQETPTEKQDDSNATYSFYTIKNFNHVPKPGFDCSNLIMRAAQIAGIPFFYKNSLTITTHLKPLRQNQILEAGDIIWIPGHVLIVADLQKNTVIEARGYTYKGSGKIREISLKKVFKHIKNFNALTQAWRTQKPLERLGDDGSTIERIKQYNLLSLQSIMT